MNIKKYEKYVDKMCYNIKNKLGEETEEFDFFLVLVNTFNEIRIKNKKLENALDEIENILNASGKMACYTKSRCLLEEDIDDIEEIIKKAKGDVKNEN